MRVSIEAFVVALAVHSLPAAAQVPSSAIDALMAPYVAPDAPGASVIVIHNGRTVLAKSYGLADLESKTPITDSTNFRLASLSKQFTATAIMLLVADGVLRYDDSVMAILPNAPNVTRGVTVRHLLTHTSGLPDYEAFVPDTQTAQVHDADVPALIARATAAKFAPGTGYAYSNTGYALLALIVEQRAFMPYADFLHDRIFAPLGMRGTVAFEEGRSTVRSRAYGHTVRSAGTRRTDQSSTSAVLGDGGIYSSIADLAKWDRAVEEHALVSAEAQQLAWTPARLQNRQETGYGFGWFVDRDHGALRVRHHGESRGFTNGIVRFPERRLTVIVLTNRSGGSPWDIAQRIAELYLDPRSGGPSKLWRP